ncbi:von Willebrand factor A domain-containing protein 3A-like isoform X2 [Rhopilema esculentum]|uniref:von Willebrand factor A domain-containing protein 3A-like isoform X2 n=1 Tax=Rhopilema esculentum TaxID=499914 RepID=UPI0031D278F4
MLATRLQQAQLLQDDAYFNSKKDEYFQMLVKDIEVARAEGQSSKTWLDNHSLAALSLTVEDILKEGIPVKPPSSESQDPDRIGQHLKFYNSVLNEFESKLKRFLTICQERIRWLLRDSRRAFGLLTGSKPCILLDVSDTNTGFGRLALIQESLKQLVGEQLARKEKLFLCSFGTDVQPLWNAARDVNARIIDEANHWIDCLQPDGGCNVMSVVRKVVKRHDIDSIILILGNCPDQNPQTIIDYVHESIVGRSLPFHTVAYNCSISATNMFLEELANATQGRYHCYSATSEADIMTGTDLQMLSQEIRRTVQILSQISDMRKGGMVEGRFISIADQPCLEIEAAKQGKQVQIYQGNTTPLIVETPSFPVRTSKDWLNEHSLKAKGLTLYQVMAPNAFNYVNGYVSSINRSVVSQVHHRSMVQLQWHDGSTKNVHVDPVTLSNYQRHLDVVLQLYRRRMEWLTSGSRNTFGTLVEKRIVILVDMSLGMCGDMLRIHEDMRRLLEQQVSSKDLFNIICFGSNVVPFQPRMVEATPVNLESAFRWFIRQTCSGSRKFMDAFRAAVENEEERKNGIAVDGVYLVTSGIPDEPKEVSCGYIQEAFVGRDAAFHCIYYEPDGGDLPPVAGRYANSDSTVSYLKQLAHGARGRFHWINNNDIMESDDVRLVSDEIDKTHNYRKKAEVLLDTLKQRYSKGEPTEQLDSSELVPRPPSSAKKRIGPPRQTALSQARINGVRPSSAKAASSTSKKVRSRPHSATQSKEERRSLTWKPSTAASTTNLIPPLSLSDEQLSTNQTKHSKHQIKAQQQTFYTEVGNETGHVFRSYQVPTNSASKKRLACASTKAIPDHEDNITTKEWLRKYNLSKLKLDLNSTVNTTDCSHSQSKVSTLGKAVNAKYCEIFPTVLLNGKPKHLQLQPRELEEYEDKLTSVLKRYVKRLHWLLSGSRKVFGSIIEQNVIILVDVSGSMVTSIDELKKELAVIIWEQLHANNINFSIMKYSSAPTLWQATLVRPDETECKKAIEWISQFEAYGGTCTIDALKLAFQVEGLDAIYLLSDGKPDTSTSSVLREVATLHAEKKLKIHTISFNCEDSIANRFLQLLATQTGGRYHRYQTMAGIEVITQKLLSKDYNDEECESMPLFEGDDARRLFKEIKLCRQYLKASSTYRELCKSHVSKAEYPGKITVKDFPSSCTERSTLRMTEVA